VVQVTKREAGYQPPEAEAQRVKLAFRSYWKRPSIPIAGRIATLIYNSLAPPSLVTVRSTGQAGQQLVYEAGSLVIDVQMAPEMGRQRAFLAGQILHSEPTGAGHSGTDIVLRSGERQIAQTTASAEGEFDFEIGDEVDLNLRIKAPGQEEVWVTLPKQEQD